MAAAMTAAGLAAQVHEDDEWGATVVTGVGWRDDSGRWRSIWRLTIHRLRTPGDSFLA